LAIAYPLSKKLFSQSNLLSKSMHTNIKLIEAPTQLQSVISAGLTVNSLTYDIKVYINGVRYYQTTHFTCTGTSNTLTINFISANLGFDITSTDEIIITGKFINV
jgi:hypothetical protein